MRFRKAARRPPSRPSGVRAHIARWPTAHAGPGGARPSSKALGKDDLHHRIFGELAVLRRIEGILHGAHRGAMTSRVLRSAPLKSGAPFRARCSFAALPRMRMLRDAAHEAGIEMARAEEIEEGGLGIDRRDDVLRLISSPPVRVTPAARSSSTMMRLRPARIRADFDAERLEPLSPWHRRRRPCRPWEGQDRPARLRRAGQAVEEQEQRVGRARARDARRAPYRRRRRLSGDHPSVHRRAHRRH